MSETHRPPVVDEATSRKLYGEPDAAFLKAIARGAHDNAIPAWCCIVFDGTGFRVVSHGTDDKARATMASLALYMQDHIAMLLTGGRPA